MPMPSLDTGNVLVLVLEHDLALSDERLLGLLDWSEEELGRMGRFRHQGAKTSWCLSRRLFYDALRELGLGPAARRPLGRGECGKPYLPGRELRFNWSHTRGCVALALSPDRELGVDIEGLGQPRGDFLAVARDQFEAREAEWVASAAGELSWERFLSLFVQKEAFLKASGAGLSEPLAGAPATLGLPPARRPGRELLEVGLRARYFLAVEAAVAPGEAPPRILVEHRSLSPAEGERP
jgi:phosphopantetheinyl transferase